MIHFLHFFYVPSSGPWYTGAVWGNIFVLAILVPAGWIWSKTKYWPLGLIHKKLDGLHEKHDQTHLDLDEVQSSLLLLHAKHDALLDDNVLTDEERGAIVFAIDHMLSHTISDVHREPLESGLHKIEKKNARN